jgi:hypothetical protein
LAVSVRSELEVAVVEDEFCGVEDFESISVVDD